jgi:hypothetical protein
MAKGNPTKRGLVADEEFFDWALRRVQVVGWQAVVLASIRT